MKATPYSPLARSAVSEGVDETPPGPSLLHAQQEALAATNVLCEELERLRAQLLGNDAPREDKSKHNDLEPTVYAAVTECRAVRFRVEGAIKAIGEIRAGIGI